MSARKRPTRPKPKRPSAKAQAKARSEAARKGWETRKKREAKEAVRARREERQQKQLRKKRRDAAVKGWHTRRERAYERVERAAIEQDEFIELGPGVLGAPTIAERAQQFPRIAAAVEVAQLRLALEAAERRQFALRTPEPLSARDLARARLAEVSDSFEAIEAKIHELATEGEFGIRELYTLYFSPDVA